MHRSSLKGWFFAVLVAAGFTQVVSAQPRIDYIGVEDPFGTHTSNTTVKYGVYFTEQVQNFDATDLVVTSSTATPPASTTISVAPASSAPTGWGYIVTLSNYAGHLGELGIGLAASQDILSLSNLPVINTTPLNQDTFYTIQGVVGPKLLSLKRQNPTNEYTNQDTLVFRAIADSPVAGVDATDAELIIFPSSGPEIEVSTASVTMVDATTYDFTFNDPAIANQNGEASVFFLESAVITNTAGTAAVEIDTTAVYEEYILDNIAPSLVSVTRESPLTSPTNATGVTWRVIYSEDMSGVSASNFSIAETTSPATTISSVSAVNASTYLVTATGYPSTYSGDITLVPGAASDLAGNTLQSTAISGTGDTHFTITGGPTGGPKLVSIARQSPTSSPTNATSLTFRLTFDADIAGLDANDFFLSDNSTGLAISGITESVTTVTGDTVFDLVFSGAGLAAFEGQADLTPESTISVTDSGGTVPVDTTSEPSPNDFFYVLDRTAPRILSVEYNDPILPITNADSVTWLVTADEVIDTSTLQAADFTLATPGPAGASLALSDITATSVKVTASGGNMASYTGPVTLDASPTASIKDVAGNLLTDATVLVTNQHTYQLDNTAPTVVISSSATGTQNAAFGVSFTVSELLTSFEAADVVVAGGTLSNFAGPDLATGLVYTATVTPDANSTTAVTVDVLGNTFVDAANVNNTAATRLTLPVDTVAPTITISSPTTVQNGTSSVSFTTSEPTTDFAVGDISVSNGTLSNFTGSGTSYSVDVTPTSNTAGNVAIDVAAATFKDAVGNDNVAASQASVAFDTQAPTVTISGPTTTQGGAFTVTFTTSEATTDFTEFDVTMGGTGVSATTEFTSNSSTSYSLVVTPGANSNGTLTFDVAASKFTDAALNANLAATQLSVPVNTNLPTVTIASTATGTQNSAFPVTFTLSQSATDFVAGDVTVAGGTLSNFSGSGTAYSATFTPDNNSTTAATIDVAASAFTGTVTGNSSAVATQFTLPIDTVAPTVTISGPTTVQNGSFAVSFTTSETTTDFALADISVNGGTPSNFSGSGTSYSVDVTPTGNTTGNVTIDVAAAAFKDAVGNNNVAATQASVPFDTQAPTVTIAGPTTTQGGPFTVTFTTSEATTSFTDIDVSMGGSGVSATTSFTANSATSYSLLVTPGPNESGTLTFDVAANKFTDTAGNNNTAATQLSVTVDTNLPTVSIASTASGTQNSAFPVTFTLSQASTNFVATDVTVTGGTLSGFSGSGTSYSATFTPNANSTTAATIDVAASTFTGTTTGNANSAASQFTLPVDTVAPTVTISAPTTVQNNSFAVTFTTSEPTTDFQASDVSVTGGTLGSALTAISSTSYLGSVTPTPNSTGDVTIAVAAGQFSDAAGNGNAAATSVATPVDLAAPTLVSVLRQAPTSATTSADTLVFRLTFSEAVTGLATSNFIVTGGSTATVTAVSSTAGTSVDVTVSGGNLSTYVGNVGIQIVNTTGLTDNASNGLASPTPTGSNETFNRVNDAIAPTLAISGTGDCSQPVSVLFTFSENVTGFVASDIATTNASVTALTSTSQSQYTATIQPYAPAEVMTYAISMSVAAGAFTDIAGNANTAAAEHEISCVNTTFVQDRTRSVVGEQLAANALLLTSQTPDLTNRLQSRQRLQESASARSNFVAVETVEKPADLRFKADIGGSDGVESMVVELDTSLSRITNFASANAGLGLTSSPTDIWVKVRWTDDTTLTRESSNSLAYIGLDHQISNTTLVGFIAQVDSYEVKDTTKSYKGSGTGWMIGPYVANELSENLYFDARLAWGQGRNMVSPVSTYTDSFASERFLADVSLAGSIEGKGILEGLTLEPEVEAMHYQETQEAYVDTNGVTIPETKLETTRVSFGPTVRNTVALDDDSSLSFSVGVQGVWTDVSSNITNPTTGFTNHDKDSLSARVEAGLKWDWKIRNGGSTSLEVDTFFDGFMDDEKDTRGVSLKYRTKF